MQEAIHFRIITWNKGSKYRAICLETNIAFEAITFQELKMKIKDGMISYLECYSDAEIEQGAYLRPAPFVYRLLWLLNPIISLLKDIKSNKADYNPHSKNLKFA